MWFSSWEQQLQQSGLFFSLIQRTLHNKSFELKCRVLVCKCLCISSKYETHHLMSPASHFEPFACVCLHPQHTCTGIGPHGCRSARPSSQRPRWHHTLPPHPHGPGATLLLALHTQRPALWGLSCLLRRVIASAMSSFPRLESRGCLIWPQALIIWLKCRWWRCVYILLISRKFVDLKKLIYICVEDLADFYIILVVKVDCSFQSFLCENYNLTYL